MPLMHKNKRHDNLTLVHSFGIMLASRPDSFDFLSADLAYAFTV